MGFHEIHGFDEIHGIHQILESHQIHGLYVLRYNVDYIITRTM